MQSIVGRADHGSVAAAAPLASREQSSPSEEQEKVLASMEGHVRIGRSLSLTEVAEVVPPSASGTDVALYQRLKGLPAVTQCAAVLAAVASVALSGVAAWVVQAHPSAFPTGPLSILQIEAVMLCLFAVLVWLLQVLRQRSSPLSAEAAGSLQAAGEMGVYLLLFFICDRTTLLARRKRELRADFFCFLVVALFAAGACTVRRVPTEVRRARGFGAPPLFLNRYQTEEWKGWMQVLFVWYHYFANVHVYTTVRVWIASYVFLTGFGNFMFYTATHDFSLARFLRMQWRLNFLAVGACAMMGNQYMLYYICPLHTFFTVAIYVLLGVGRWWAPYTPRRTAVAAVAVVAASALLWDLPFSGVIFQVAWAPLRWLLRYDHPTRTGTDPMHEWQFRSGLDHYIWMVGAAVALLHRRLDARAAGSGTVLRWVVAGACAAAMALHAQRLLLGRQKFEYNRIHPYTSWIPVLGYVVLRNLTCTMRANYLHLFHVLGTMTLETYICSFHILMGTTGLNGNPVYTLQLLPGDYPMCDFGLFMILLFVVSRRVLHVTQVLEDWLLPAQAPMKLVGCNALLTFGCLTVCFATSAVWKYIL